MPAEPPPDGRPDDLSDLRVARVRTCYRASQELLRLMPACSLKNDLGIFANSLRLALQLMDS